MFGYVKPCKAELKIKEYETYKAVYCSLCRTLGKEYGVLTRFFLTYDAVFFALFLKCVSQSAPDCAHSGVCRFNPLKKCNYIDEDEILKKAAALTVIMFYYKLRDNIGDSPFYKKIALYLIYPYIKSKFKKAKSLYPQYNDIIKEQTDRQAVIEREKSDSVDLACDPSARALSAIFTADMTDSPQKELSARTAYCIGRWVYLMDAFDDLKKDISSSGYNPFIYYYGLSGKNAEVTENQEKEIISRIRISANEAAAAFEKLNKNCYNSIVENIVFDGLENELNILIDKIKRGDKNGE